LWGGETPGITWSTQSVGKTKKRPDLGPFNIEMSAAGLIKCKADEREGRERKGKKEREKNNNRRK